MDEIDCAQDALLFPEEGAVEVGLFPWGRDVSAAQDTDKVDNTSTSADDADSGAIKKRKKRLIVIESNWPIGKTMVHMLRTALVQRRGKEEADRLRSVTLRDGIVGNYWRFQAVGHGAVSTIEAIYHAALSAASGRLDKEGREKEENVKEEEATEEAEKHGKYWELLVLFRLQRLKLLTECREGQGKGLPRAMRVTGYVCFISIIKSSCVCISLVYICTYYTPQPYTIQGKLTLNYLAHRTTSTPTKL